MSDSVRPHRWQPTRIPVPGILQARTLEWVAISFSNAWKWKAKVKLLSPVLSSPMDCSLPGSSVHGIFQAGVLEWGAIAFSEVDLLIVLLLRVLENSPHFSWLKNLHLVHPLLKHCVLLLFRFPQSNCCLFESYLLFSLAIFKKFSLSCCSAVWRSCF